MSGCNFVVHTLDLHHSDGGPGLEEDQPDDEADEVVP